MIFTPVRISINIYCIMKCFTVNLKLFQKPPLTLKSLFEIVQNPVLQFLKDKSPVAVRIN